MIARGCYLVEKRIINPLTTGHPGATTCLGTARAVGDLVVHTNRLELEPCGVPSTSIRLLRSSVFKFVTSPAHVEIRTSASEKDKR